MADNACMTDSRSVRSLAITLLISGALLLSACTTPPASVATPEVVTSDKPQDSTQVEVSPKWDTSYCAKKSEQDVAVKVLRRTSPKINANWFPEGLKAKVIFLLEVTPESKLGRIAYFPPDTDARIVKAVTTSLRQWRFKAASYQGQPVSTCLEQPYELIFPARDEN